MVFLMMQIAGSCTDWDSVCVCGGQGYEAVSSLGVRMYTFCSLCQLLRLMHMSLQV